jgi:hypothetical protein
MFHIDAPVAHIPKLLIGFVFAAGCGGFELWRGLNAGDRKVVDAAVLEAGADPPGEWLEVHGRALWQDAAVNNVDGGVVVWFVPVVSEDWKRPNPVAVFLEWRLNEREGPPKGRAGPSRYTGTIVRGRGLGAASRSYFDSVAIHRADKHIILEHGANPRNLIESGLTGLGLGAACLALMPVARWSSRRAARKTEAA